MFSANTFKSAWLSYCKKLVKENNHYYLVKNDNPNIIWHELKQKGFHCIGPSNALSYPIVCINIETMTFFSGLIGYEGLGIEFNNKQIIGYDDFVRLL